MNGVRRSVLLVEDDPDDVEILQLVLEGAGSGASFEVAVNGVEAMDRLNAARASPPSLVLLDLNLPIVRGDEVLAFMKREPPLSLIPVAVLTSSDAPTDRERCSRYGCVAYLVKPKDLRGFRDLAKVIVRMVDLCGAT